jgi:hypothetical protein
MAGHLSHLQVADWIAIAAALVALIGILIATLVAYHIATRQGVFRKPSLITTFGPEDSPPPTIILLNLTNLPQPKNVAGLYYLILNNGKGPLSNISIQFNLTPKGLEEAVRELGALYGDDKDFKMYSIGESDVLEFKYASLAPKQGEVIFLPFLVHGPALPSYGQQLGSISVYITYDQGDRVAQQVTLAAVTEADFEDLSARHDPHLLQRLDQVTIPSTKRSLPTHVEGWKIMKSAFFASPFFIASWVVLNISFKSVSQGLAVDAVLVDKLNQGMFPGTAHFGFNLRGRLVFLMKFFGSILVMSGAYAVLRYWGWIS